MDASRSTNLACSNDKPKSRNLQKLERTTLRTSRLLDFCSEKELIAQTGHQTDAWPLVVVGSPLRKRRSKTQGRG